MDESDDARENSIRSGFLSAHTHTQKARLTALEYSFVLHERRNTHRMMSKCPF